MEIELDSVSNELNDLDFISSVSISDSELNKSIQNQNQNQNINVYLIKSKFDDDLLEIFTFEKSFISVESYKYHYIIKLIDGSIIFTDKCHTNILQVLQYDKSISILHKNESEVGYSGLIQIIFLDGLVKYFDINKREIIFEFNYGFKFNVDDKDENNNREKEEYINSLYKYDSSLEKLKMLRINGLPITEIFKKKMLNIILMKTNNFLENEITNSSFDFKQNLFNQSDKINNSNLGKIHKAVENNVSAINFITKYTSNQKTVILSLINARNEFIIFDENYKKQLVSELYVENNCKF